MCNLSAGAVKKGFDLGWVDGKESTSVEHIKNLMANLSITFDEAVKLLGIPQSEIETYRSKI
jgi:hypothetical protein